jgi:tetratricopeptide (TPR) repeat protein
LPVPADQAASKIEAGIALLRSHQLHPAKDAFSAGLTINPRSVDALTWRGITENQLEEYKEAVRDFDSALRIDPDALPAHYNLALSLIKLGQTDPAIKNLEVVVKAQPAVAEAQYNLAILLESKQALSQAVEHLQAAYQAQPEDNVVNQHLMLDLLLLGRENEAQASLEKFLQAATPDSLQQSGVALLAAGCFKQAVLLFEAEQARAPDNKGVGLLLARAYIGAQEDHKAISLLETLPQGDEDVAYLRGLAYAATGASEEAESAFQHAARINPRSARAFYQLGLLESAVPAQQSEAIQHLEMATQLDPGNAPYEVVLARILLEHDQVSEAASLLRRVRTGGPESAERNLLLGIAEVSQGNAAGALPKLEESVTQNPKLALSHNMLGFCYFAQGAYAKAAEAYRDASNISPETLIFAHNAAIAFERSDNLDQAMVYAKRAAALNAGGEDHYVIGKLLAKTGRRDEAIRELKQAIALSPDLEASYYLLARIYMQLNEAEQAAAWSAKLTELKQKHERAYVASKRQGDPLASTLLQGARLNAAEVGNP